MFTESIAMRLINRAVRVRKRRIAGRTKRGPIACDGAAIGMMGRGAADRAFAGLPKTLPADKVSADQIYAVSRTNEGDG